MAPSTTSATAPAAAATDNLKIAVVAHREKLTKADAKRLRAALHDAGLDATTWLQIDKGKRAAKAAAKAVDGGADVVIVCGGDGTVRAAAGALVDTGAALAVVPAGTANLFAGALGLPDEPAELAELIRSGRRRTIDTGSCNGEPFIVMAGVGFDAAMVDDADEGKERLGMIAYLKAGLRQARDREPFTANVTVDDCELFEGEATCVLVGNVGTLKGGVQAFPDASVTDGLLDIAVITATGLREWAGLMVDAVRHRQHSASSAQLAQGRTIEVKLDGTHRFELDGGAKGTGKKFKLKVHPASLTVCAPPPTP